MESQILKGIVVLLWGKTSGGNPSCMMSDSSMVNCKTVKLGAVKGDVFFLRVL